MRPFELASVGNANLADEAPCITFEGACSGLTALMAVCRRLWPEKTARNLAAETGVSERMAAYWLAGKYDMTLTAAHRLIRSRHGYQFLAALMSGSQQGWWKWTEHAHEIAEAQAEAHRAQKRIDRLRAKQRQLSIEL